MSMQQTDVRESLAAVLDDSLLCWTYNGTQTVFHPMMGADAVLARFDVHPRGTDWRVLGGVIPGPIPVEWVRVGDTIQDHGVTGTITRTVRTGGRVHLVIGSGHVSFEKVARQDFITVLSTGATNHLKGSTK